MLMTFQDLVGQGHCHFNCHVLDLRILLLLLLLLLGLTLIINIVTPTCVRARGVIT